MAEEQPAEEQPPEDNGVEVQASGPAECVLSFRVSSGEGLMRLKEGGSTTGGAPVRDTKSRGYVFALSRAREQHPLTINICS
jgi:hypothetical protein